MGPLFFLIYVKDLPCASSFQTTLFADDTSLHLSNKDIKMLQLNVQNEFAKVDTWMRSNRLSINYNKTAYMILIATLSQNCNFEISMNGVRIQQTDSRGMHGLDFGCPAASNRIRSLVFLSVAGSGWIWNLYLLKKMLLVFYFTDIQPDSNKIRIPWI